MTATDEYMIKEFFSRVGAFDNLGTTARTAVLTVGAVTACERDAAGQARA